jgi:hypothetical protein
MIPMLADGLIWITIIATAQLVMWVIAGPAKQINFANKIIFLIFHIV